MLSIDNSSSTEAEIQHELASQLQKFLGYSIYLEREFDLPSLPKTRRADRVRKIRVDIAVCYHDELICVIEVKNHKNPSSDILPSGRQLEKYTALGLPFFFCWNEKWIGSVINQVSRLVIEISDPLVNKRTN